MSTTTNQNARQTNRRRFLQDSGAAAVALPLSAAPAKAQTPCPREQLAIDSRPKAVTASHIDATTLPQYGKQEEEAVLALMRSPSYDPITKLERKRKEFFGVTHATSYLICMSVITAMVFAPDLPPGSEANEFPSREPLTAGFPK
ncbi:MAG: twin-arginine translocation signal domain-containing protein [Limisphaerales bacterium]